MITRLDMLSRDMSYYDMSRIDVSNLIIGAEGKKQADECK